MKLMNTYTGKFHLLLLMLIFALFSSCSNNETTSGETKVAEQISLEKSIFKPASDTEIAVEPPPLTDGIFPCNDCHSEIEPNPERRELVDMHDDITALFNHDSENRWCLDCHDASNRDSLRLASGKLLDFKESYKLCGQCHGEKLRDWKVGVHGKRTGEWNGQKEYLLCVHCHNPHAPKFEAITPEPPPVMQENISYRNINTDEQ
ncbi:cytochrome c3 family protein [uncultured Draconibacterium sp.]|uniref:cytochrome c3 family protein n=1 Tax=uncultured Draconibacterium sp. TaxID=1573823 RepID=UPI003217D12A